MIIKEIIQIGNPILGRKSEAVKDIQSADTQRVIADLIDSMRFHGIIGMAASQIGAKLRIFVTEVRKTEFRNLATDKLRVYINPKIIWRSEKETEIYEGCGSVAYAKLFAPVIRPEEIEIEAHDVEGKRFKLKVGGMLGRVIQHEYDHLDGIEFTEKISDIKRIMSSEEYKKMMSPEKMSDKSSS